MCISIAAVGAAQPCWRGIRFDGGSSGALSFAHLSNGGCGTTGTIEIGGGGPVIVTDTTIDASNADDVRLDDTASATLQQDNFGPVPAGSFAVENGGWNTSQPKEGATCNWWGAASGPAGAAKLRRRAGERGRHFLSVADGRRAHLQRQL